MVSVKKYDGGSLNRMQLGSGFVLFTSLPNLAVNESKVYVTLSEADIPEHSLCGCSSKPCKLYICLVFGQSVDIFIDTSFSSKFSAWSHR